MLSNKINIPKRKHNKTIQHKITATIFYLIILTYIIVKLLNIIFNHLITPYNTIITICIFIIYSYLISSFIAKVLSYKFVDQVNNMANLAKAIARSKDLNRRVSISKQQDELSNLEEALNEMLNQIEIYYEKQQRFVSDASHELRTPIAIIKGYLDILDDWGKDDPMLLNESIKSMQEETYHMKKLIENLLFLAKSDQQQVSYEFELLQLDTLIDKVVKNSNLISKGKTIKSIISDPVQIIGDKELILQMLRALIENSIKYTSEAGLIIINCRKKNEFAKIEIIDDGIGISSKNLDEIFDRFYRVEEARDKNSGGSGLGLSLVKSIIDIHKGKITIDSELGKGTKINVFLPLNI